MATRPALEGVPRVVQHAVQVPPPVRAVGKATFSLWLLHRHLDAVPGVVQHPSP